MTTTHPDTWPPVTGPRPSWNDFVPPPCELTADCTSSSAGYVVLSHPPADHEPRTHIPACHRHRHQAEGAAAAHDGVAGQCGQCLTPMHLVRVEPW